MVAAADAPGIVDTAATIIGAGAGAYAGNQVEKNKNTNQYWNVRVRFEDGTTQTLRYETAPNLRNGDRVRVENGKLVSRG